MRTISEDFDLLTPSEVAVLLRIKLSTVYAAVATGRLRCVRLWKGRRKSLVRFRRADIDALITGNPTTCTPLKSSRSR